jgi:hypothetical protein
MAYLDNTVLNDFQAREATNEKFDANYGMLDLAKDSTSSVDYVPPSVQEMLATSSNARNAKIPVLKDQSVTVTTTPGFENIPVNLGETDSYYFTAYDVFSGFRYFPASFAENQVDKQWYFDNVLRNVLKACASTADDIIETNLESRKTQVLNYTTQISQGDGTFTFDAGTDTLQISKAAQKDTMFTYLKQLMIANQLGGNYRIVTSPGGLLVSEVEAAKYGANNTKDLMWSQSAVPMDRRYISDQISTSANFNGFFVKDGDIGLYENFPYDFRNGTEVAGKKWSISDVELPYMRMRANVYVNNEATDATALVTPGSRTDLKMTVFQEMALWFRFYVVYRYNSSLSTRQNGIVKLLGQTS